MLPSLPACVSALSHPPASPTQMAANRIGGPPFVWCSFYLWSVSMSARVQAVSLAQSRSVRTFDRPQDGQGRFQRISGYFGARCFGPEKMKERLPPEIFRRWLDIVEQGARPERSVADAIAHAVKEWAIEAGATHFCHWFHPMTGLTAEKHDSFLAFDNNGKAIEKFTGSMLIQSEPDASSFPSGGMRSTFEARGYTSWDPTSPMFLMDTPNGRTLCIPSAFLGYHGQALDEKAPLLRSMEAVNKAAVALMGLLGEQGVSRVTATVGPEQEYFVVDRAYVAARPDLAIAGRSLLGAKAPKGQSLEDHYFGSIPQRVQSFMEEVETELYLLGVSAKTRHNEVAPSQFEIAPIFSEANLAADHNQLVMSTLRKVAARHDLVALLHEKPFAGVNGSGKHLNWSMADNRGVNLLEPGSEPHQNLRFLAVLAGVMLGVHRHASLLRAAIASSGNDFRLGANEAPPAIISVFLGDTLTEIVEAFAKGTTAKGNTKDALIELGVDRLPAIAKDNTDRNRTSPFAFTGNKFEFRAVGASASISWPATCLNTAVADGLTQLAAWISEDSTGDRVLKAVRKALVESAPVRFDGNNYSEEWVQEAEKRGLPHARNTPAALTALWKPETEQLFSVYKVLSPEELHARAEVRLDQYNKRVEIELDLLTRLVDTQILPVVEREVREFSGSWRGRKLSDGLVKLEKLRVELGALLEKVPEGEAEKAAFLCGSVLPASFALRDVVDGLEAVVSDANWPLPKYHEILFLN
jgi:glutamine synthetase